MYIGSLFYSLQKINFSFFPSHFLSLSNKKRQIYSLHSYYLTAWLRKLRDEMESKSSSHSSKLNLKDQDLSVVWSTTEQAQYLFNKGKISDRLHGNLCCLNPFSLAWMLPGTFGVIDKGSSGYWTRLTLKALWGRSQVCQKLKERSPRFVHEYIKLVLH